MLSVEKNAKTVEEAVALALEEMGATMDEVEVTVLDEGTKGFLGIGSKEASVRVVRKNDPVVRAQAFLDGLFELAKEDVTVTIDRDGERMSIDLSGPDMGIVIGKHGETLDALQHLTSLVANRGDADFVKVAVDCENYREKRNEALSNLAHKMAKKVARTGRNTTLEPMNAYERRIIHATLQDDPDVTTYSVGSGLGRRVVVALKGNEHYSHKRER